MKKLMIFLLVFFVNNLLPTVTLINKTGKDLIISIFNSSDDKYPLRIRYANDQEINFEVIDLGYDGKYVLRCDWMQFVSQIDLRSDNNAYNIYKIFMVEQFKNLEQENSKFKKYLIANGVDEDKISLSSNIIFHIVLENDQIKLVKKDELAEAFKSNCVIL